MKVKNFKVKVFSVILGGAIVFGSFGVFQCSKTQAKAEETGETSQNEISSMYQLKKAVEAKKKDGQLTDSEKVEILKNTDKNLLIEYYKSKEDAIEEKINNGEGKVISEEYNPVTGDSKTVFQYKIDDIITVESEINDNKDEIEPFLGKVTLSFGGSKKDLGKRRTTGTMKGYSLGVKVAQFNLTLRYTIYKTKIVATEAFSSDNYAVGDYDVKNVKITDKYANKVGENMNCVGTFSYSLFGKAKADHRYELIVKWAHNVDSNTRFISYRMYN